MSATKTRFPHAEAAFVAGELTGYLFPCCEQIAVVGSLRRGKTTVGDIELLLVPKLERGRNPVDLFEWVTMNLADEKIEDLVKSGILARRKNSLDRESWGPKNKLAVHCASGIPVDLFSTERTCWFNSLVCRTGPAESNVRIAEAAQKKGWRWNMSGPGFTHLKDGTTIRNLSEYDVFRFVGLPCLKPEERT